MNTRRAQDILRHITKDEDYGIAAFEKLSLTDSIYVVNRMLPECIKKAVYENNDNDAGYFSKIAELYRPLTINKINAAEHLWVVYSNLTGYPYYVDGDLMVAYDFTACQNIERQLCNAGYDVTFGVVDNAGFKSEIAHMYRNGYRNIKFTDGKGEPFEVAREEFYSYEEFFDDKYITNPALEAGMIDFLQEYRKKAAIDGREEMLKRREDKMFEAMVNSEFMIPCVKEEKEEEIEISHPFIDLSDRATSKDGGQVIAVPAFTDGFELEKCYKGHYETMLYQFKELVSLVDELGASGVIINCLGVSYYMDRDILKKVSLRA